ncbi:putative DnaJ like protein subfamily C member 9 [Glarea lozoyensis 74030]|uniref:Putative DnaJ like protein subfamily C member 9 n=1 Tax=Glarea lozoyensis (strain ATCC 74030 / MF5533) TaxID=1104152 RepID=H0ELG0_GLAL7|nr:putative DnaJ like protein subfamily C member 9 [Glarea lozoyensis 74030]
MPPRKRKDEEEELVDEEPPSIEPYKVLALEKSATADEIKYAYRKAALKHHPDKAPEHLKDEAHTKFQEIAFAYAVLSDPIRRKRYDVTGSTSESIDADGFKAIEIFSKGYKGSDEEKDDLLDAYTKAKGKWSGIYSTVMLSDPLEDEDRFREIIDKAIAQDEVKPFKAYTGETEKAKENRMKQARKEGKEAMEYAQELGVADKLFGKSKGKKDSGEDGLAALIRKRQADRGSFFDNLEAKYSNEKKPKKGKGKKRVSEDEDDEDEMPSEEAFQAAAARLKSQAGDEEKPKKKRAKR